MQGPEQSKAENERIARLIADRQIAQVVEIVMAWEGADDGCGWEAFMPSRERVRAWAERHYAPTAPAQAAGEPEGDG